MAVTDQMTVGNGVPFLISAEVVYAIVAAACSSPQTTELNAGKRAGTLMKWVHIGLIQSAVLVAAASLMDRPRAKAYIAGGIVAGGFMYVSYAHAKAAGLQNGGPTTEDW